MKKRILAVLCLTVALTVTGCGQSASGSASEKEIAELKAEIEELKEENNELKAKIYDYENNKPAQATESSELDGFVAETSGVCGADLTWEYGNGILRISGTGEMSDYWHSYDDDRPWKDITDKINHVYIEDGCTYIGHSAFREINGLSKVVLPNSISKFGNDCVFWECPNLKKIIWGRDEYEIDGQDLSSLEDKICNDGHAARGMFVSQTVAAEVEAAP